MNYELVLHGLQFFEHFRKGNGISENHYYIHPWKTNGYNI